LEGEKQYTENNDAPLKQTKPGREAPILGELFCGVWEQEM